MDSVSRLIRTFVPEHYTVSISFERPARTFSGTVTINGTAKDIDGTLHLHAKDLTIHSTLVDGKKASFRKVDDHEISITHSDLQAGDHIIVIEFSGAITDDMSGIYPSYYTENGTKKELIVTQFESHHAREAFPCIDEPEAKATFDVTLTTEPGITVLGNMPIETQKEENGQLVTSFQTTPRMSSYLVAWVFGELQSKTTTTKSGVEVSVWSTKAHDPSNLDYALAMAARCIEFFNDYFGVPYPLPKADHVAVPDFSAGAMENWGLITYRELTLLVDPKTTTLAIKHYVATVIAHELSHQWFGNLVTMKWWNDLWLNESFANMMEHVAVDGLEPSWNIWLDHSTTEVVSALRRDSIDGVQSIKIDVNHPDEISSVFDPSIVYAKGGRLLRMLQAYIGDDAMHRGLKTYFETHAYQNTEADDLWKALGDASGEDIPALMHSWMTQPGFPVVTASKNGDRITLSQEQFYIGPHKSEGRTWPIPLHGSSTQIPSLMNEPTIAFSYTDSEVFRLNQGSTAHFITHYTGELLNELVKNIASLPTIDRLGFLHEQMLLAQGDVQSTAALIPLIQHFKNETNESVWSMIALAINEIKRFVETDESIEAKLKLLVKNLTQLQYDRLGWEPNKDEDENDTKLRSLIISLALFGENEHAVAEANKLYKTKNLQELDPELRTAIMSNAVRQQVTPDVIESLLKAYIAATNSELREDIALALTSSRQLETIKQLADHLKDSSVVRKQDVSHWYVWLIRNRYGRDYMWSWIRDNWQWIDDSFHKDHSYDMYPRYIAAALVTEQQLEEYKAFFGPLEVDRTLSRNIKIGYTELEGRIAHLALDMPVVHQALRKIK